ncbi:MAG: hypothetical protein ACTS9Y_00915 [Methylophilus sp.]|uniref:hypothetical protein n=1 Tax=Methylophilus sp. TaxID=29541 RepID=UPI003FA04025
MSISTSESFRTLQGATQIVAQAFAREAGISVTFGNYATAYIGVNKQGKKEIHLPSLPPNLEEAKILTYGFLTHEIAHENYTDFGVAIPKNSSKRSLFMVLEDVRIELLRSARYPGSKINLMRLLELLVAQNKFWTYKPGLSPSNLIVGYTSTVLRSDLLGQATTQLAQIYELDLVNSISIGAKTKLDALIYTIGDLKNTSQVIQLVDQIFDMLEDEKQDLENPQQPGADDSKSDANQSQNSQGKGSDSSNTQTQASEQDDEQSSNPSNDSKGQGKGDDQSKSSDSPDGKADNQKPDSNPSDSDDGKDDKQNQNGDQNSSDDSNHSQDKQGQGKGKGQSDDDSSNSDQNSSNDSNPNPGPQSQSEGTNQQNGDGAGGKLASNIDSILQGKDDLGDVDLGDILSKHLNELAQQPANQRNAVTPMLQDSLNSGVDSNLLTEVRASSNATRMRILSLLEAQAKVRKIHSNTGSKIDPKRIARVASGNFDIFTKLSRTITQNTAIEILIDISGSMQSGDRYKLALNSGLAVALALEQAKGVKVSVSAFPFANKVLKLTSFAERASGTSVRYTKAKPNGGTPMSEAIMTASYDLLSQDNDRLLCIVITDGQPDNADSCKQVIESVSEMGVEFVGLGIGVALPDYFKDSRSISKIDELPMTMFELLKRKLVDRR